MNIPIICETPGCKNGGRGFNYIRGIEARHIEAFYEDYDGTNPEDRCPICRQPGIALDPETESEMEFS